MHIAAEIHNDDIRVRKPNEKPGKYELSKRRGVTYELSLDEMHDLFPR